MKYREIAAHLGISPNAVNTLLAAGLPSVNVDAEGLIDLLDEVGVGQDQLHRALARAFAVEAAILERLQRAVDLVPVGRRVGGVQAGDQVAGRVVDQLLDDVDAADQDVLFRYDDVKWNPPLPDGVFTQPVA